MNGLLGVSSVSSSTPGGQVPSGGIARSEPSDGGDASALRVGFAMLLAQLADDLQVSSGGGGGVQQPERIETGIDRRAPERVTSKRSDESGPAGTDRQTRATSNGADTVARTDGTSRSTAATGDVSPSGHDTRRDAAERGRLGAAATDGATSAKVDAGSTSGQVTRTDATADARGGGGTATAPAHGGTAADLTPTTAAARVAPESNGNPASESTAGAVMAREAARRTESEVAPAAGRTSASERHSTPGHQPIATTPIRPPIATERPSNPLVTQLASALLERPQVSSRRREEPFSPATEGRSPTSAASTRTDRTETRPRAERTSEVAIHASSRSSPPQRLAERPSTGPEPTRDKPPGGERTIAGASRHDSPAAVGTRIDHGPAVDTPRPNRTEVAPPPVAPVPADQRPVTTSGETTRSATVASGEGGTLHAAGAAARTTGTVLPGAAALRAPAQTPPGQEQQLLDQILKGIQVHRRNGTTEMTLTLRPESLGRLAIRISHEADGLVARLHAEHAVTRDLIERALPRLVQLLEQAGHKVDRIEFGSITQEGGDGPDAETNRQGLLARESADDRDSTSKGRSDPDNTRRQALSEDGRPTSRSNPIGSIRTDEIPVPANGRLDTFA